MEGVFFYETFFKKNSINRIDNCSAKLIFNKNILFLCMKMFIIKKLRYNYIRKFQKIITD